MANGYDSFFSGAAETPESGRAEWERQQIPANAARDIAADSSVDQGNSSYDSSEGREAPQGPEVGRDASQAEQPWVGAR